MNTMTMANALKAVFGAQTLTTASYFPACAQDGTPSGVISAANLASLLGVINKLTGTCLDGQSGTLDIDVYPGSTSYASLYKIDGGYWRIFILGNHSQEIFYYVGDDSSFPPAKTAWKKVTAV